MTEPGGRRRSSSASDSWEQRAAGLASEIQRWLIRTSARSMRDEVGGQVRKALRGAEPAPGDIWATATTESPGAAAEAPECAWCPVCRAARRISRAREATDGRGGPRISDAADIMAAAVSDALAGLDAILSYRPHAEPGSTTANPAGAPPAGPGSTAANPAAPPAGPGSTAANPAGAPPAGPGSTAANPAAPPAEPGSPPGAPPAAGGTEEGEDEPRDRG